MTALVTMRLRGFVRGGRALAPTLAGLVVLGILYGGGRAQAGEAYGVSAVVLFPVLAWQTKLLLDMEPDVQRRLAMVAVGPRREVIAGLLAAAVLSAATVVLALALPWGIGGVTGPQRPGDLELGRGVALGVWAHLLMIPAAVALGAFASRAVTRSQLYGVTILVTGGVAAVVFGLSDSVAPWLVPPLMAVARVTASAPARLALLQLTLHGLLWAAVVLSAYGWVRTRRT